MSGVFLCGYLFSEPSVEEREAKRESLDIITFPFAGLTQT